MRPARDPAELPPDGIDATAFDVHATRLRPALRLHCYRLTGSLDEAEDLVQVTLERAWRQRASLVDEEGLRPWLYRIATNASIDLLRQRRRRPVRSLDDEAAWADPLPVAWLMPGDDLADPEAAAIRRETVGLAFLTAVQVLPPRLRAMLVLRDVLEWSASAVAAALGTSTTAVHSGVRRARAIVQASADALPPVDQDEASAATARRYLEAWERADPSGLARLLATDASMAMPPDPRAFRGRASVVAFLAETLARPSSERIRLLPVAMVDAHAFVVSMPAADGRSRPIGVKVLVIHHGLIRQIRGHMHAPLAHRFLPGQA